MKKPDVIYAMNKSEKIEILKDYPDILIFDELVDILNVGINTTYELLRQKKIYSKKIGKEYKIPKICVIDYIYNNKETNFSNYFNDYGDILDYKEVRKILRNPSRNTLYKILKDKEIFFIKIANEYKIPRSSLIEYVFKEYL